MARTKVFSVVGALLAATTGLAILTSDPALAQPTAPAAPFVFPTKLPGSPVRSIEKITGNLYRAGNGNWHVAFLVTKDGIVLVDTVNTEFSTWLKAEFAKRFPGIPVKYVIYSHSHWDHIEGGAVFADTATFVGQEGMLRNLDGRYPHMPGDMTDRNDDGKFEVNEVTQPFLDHLWICGGFPQSVTDKDFHHDGKVTPAEFYSEVRKPDIVYSDRMTIVLGGETIQLIFPGKNHANDGTVVYFPAERTVFSVDFPADALVTTSMRSLPSACGPFDGHPLSEWIKSYKTIEDLDFDILAQGHGDVMFTKQDVTEGRQYFEYLTKQVSDAMSRGLSLDEMRKTIMLEKYKDWAQYDRLRVMNIEAAYYNLKIYR